MPKPRSGLHSTYYQATIHHQDTNGPISGYRLPWTATLHNGERIAADTLAGIKQAIREQTTKA